MALPPPHDAPRARKRAARHRLNPERAKRGDEVAAKLDFGRALASRGEQILVSLLNEMAATGLAAESGI